jgi:hypothetical protein
MMEPLINQGGTMSILERILGKSDAAARPASSERVRTTADRPYAVARPVAGFVCMDSSLKQLMQADLLNMQEIFFESRCSSVQVPLCNVLFLYCMLQDDGGIEGVGLRIRDIARLSQAHIVIVASDNTMEKYQHAMQPKNDWPANIVLVNNRNGQKFIEFFYKLFADMYNGTSMPMAWVKLAPQNPRQDQSDVPGAIALLEAGHLTFSSSTEAETPNHD